MKQIYLLIFIFLLLIFSNISFLFANNGNNKFKAIENTENEKLKEEIFSLKYSDPNLAISLCLKSLEEYIPSGPSSTTLFLYSTLGELYLKKDLPVLALSYLEDAMYEYNLLRFNDNDKKYFKISQPSQKPWLILNIGNIFFNQGQFDKALERYQLAESYFLQVESIVSRTRGLSTTYNNMALYYIEANEFSKSLEFINKALSLRLTNNFNPADISHSYKSLCELYFIWEMPEKANQYLMKTDSINRDINKTRAIKKNDFDEIVYSLAFSYVGNCYQYLGEYFVRNADYVKAIISYKKSLNYYKYFPFQKISLINKIAKAYYYIKDYDKCLKSIEECILLSKEKNLKNEIEQALELKIKVLNKLGLKDDIDLVVDQVLKSKDYRYSVQISQLLSGIESKNEILIKKREIEANKREIEEEKQKNFKFILFSIIAILLFASFAIYFFYRKLLLDKKMVIATQNEKIAQSDLEHKKRELAVLSTNIIQENEQMSSILKDLKYYVSLLSKNQDKNVFNPLLNKLKRFLTNENKDYYYSEQFSVAYPGYLEYLTRTYNELTTSDLKLCTFLRMNLNTKEMAEIMGLSIRSVESRRYRLRKKLGLRKDEDLVSFLISLKF